MNWGDHSANTSRAFIPIYDEMKITVVPRVRPAEKQLASAEASLTEDDKEFGAALVQVLF